MDADPYVYPGTRTLKNLRGILDEDELLDIETQLTYARLLDFLENPIELVYNFAGLQSIHFELFHGLYEWAGQIRTVDIRRPVGQAVPFLHRGQIQTAAGFVFADLEQQNFLCALGKPEFVDGLAYFYDQVNYIHPFREGNGRTQHYFFQRLADSAGWSINWSLVSGEQNDLACRLAVEENTIEPLREMFTSIVSSRNEAIFNSPEGNTTFIREQKSSGGENTQVYYQQTYESRRGYEYE